MMRMSVLMLNVGWKKKLPEIEADKALAGTIRGVRAGAEIHHKQWN
jgi:hypothetical protein